MSQTVTTDTAEAAASSGLRWPWPGLLASSRFRRLSREFFWIVLGKVAAVGGAVVGVRILTELMEPTSYGQLALGMTVGTLVRLVVLGPLSNGATRFYAPAREAGALGVYFSAIRSLVVRATGAVVLFALALCIGLAATGYSRWIGLALAATLFALLSGYNGVLDGMQNAARQRIIVAFHQGLASWGRFALAAALLVWLGATSTAAMLGYSLAMVVVIASQYAFFRRVNAPAETALANEREQTQRYRVQVIAYSWPFATWGVVGWAGMVSDRWALHLFGAAAEEVGLYAVLFQLGYYPMTLLATLGTTFLAPIYFQRVGDASDLVRLRNVYSLSWKITVSAIVATLLLAGSMALVHRQVFSLLVAEKYASVSRFLPAMVLAAGLYVCAQFCTVVLQAQQRTSALIVPKNVCHGIGVLLVFAGAAWYGVVGVVVGKIVYAIVHLIWIMKLARWQHARVQEALAEGSR